MNTVKTHICEFLNSHGCNPVLPRVTAFFYVFDVKKDSHGQRHVYQGLQRSMLTFERFLLKTIYFLYPLSPLSLSLFLFIFKEMTSKVNMHPSNPHHHWLWHVRCETHMDSHDITCIVALPLGSTGFEPC
jgi:hypothetical protein